MRRPYVLSLTLVAMILCGTACSSSTKSSGAYPAPPKSTGTHPTSTTSPDNGELTRAGVQLTIPQTIQFAYDAGFHREDQLVTVVSIGIAESSLYTQHRHWHPEYGLRPATAVIGVQGTTSTWNANHTRQVSSDRGVWQISTHWWPQYNDARSDDPARAAQVVWEMSKGGTDFRPWDSWYRSKNAQRHYDSAYDGWPAVRPLVREFLANLGVR
jgi:lysozyme-like protein